MSPPSTVDVLVAPELRRFAPEIEYVLHVINRWTGGKLSLAESARPGVPVIDYGPKPGDGAIWIRECFFSRACAIGAQGLTLEPGYSGLTAERVARTETLGVRFTPLFGEGAAPPILPPGETGCGWQVRFDLFGGLFFLLSRIEELERRDLDQHGRFQPTSTLAHRLGFLDRPEADYYVELLFRILAEIGVDATPPRSGCRIHLTHDVDRLRSYHSLPVLLRETLGTIRHGRDGVIGALRDVLRRRTSGEPDRSFRYLMDQAEKRNHACKFFFIAGTRHPVDADYSYRFRADMGRVAAEVRRRGHGLGFHAGYLTYDNAEEWQAQRRTLEEIIGQPVTEGRQHVIRFHPYTWQIWERAGMERDYSLAFPYGVCYRAGTSRSYPAYGVRERRQYSLEVVPTALMEFALFQDKYVELTEAQAYDQIARAVEEHRKFGGDLVILFHPVVVMGMTDQYERTLDMAFAAAGKRT